MDWAWDPAGWLHRTGYFRDFAGSGVVHLLGATCSLIGCYIIGPRTLRFSKDGELNNVPGHSVPLAGLGGFILIFGFLAFNGGSQGSISNPGDGDTVGLAIVNTILGASTGGLTVLFINKFCFHQPWSFLMTLNGALTGMVSLCAGCDLYEPWAALIVGTWGGLAFIGLHHLMVWLQLDEAAYPVTAWLEHQYSRETLDVGMDLPVNMNQPSVEPDNDDKAYTDL